jgi:hypothetical protein
MLDFIEEKDDSLYIFEVPEKYDFNIRYEPSRMRGQNYAINSDTNEVVGLSGSTTFAPHGNYFREVESAMFQHLGEEQTKGAKVKWKDARNNAFVMCDIVLPNNKYAIYTDKHKTECSQRVIALHGIDGKCSNQVCLGAIDFHCLNGQINGEHERVTRKNTTNFTLQGFIDKLSNASELFELHMERQQRWANTSLRNVNIEALLEKIMPSKSIAKKMLNQYNEETLVRGVNLFSLYSAFTNYSTYADTRNNFKNRNTSNDTQAWTMWLREKEVASWVNTEQFQSLETVS